MEFNFLTIRQVPVSKQLSAASNIFKGTAWTYFSFAELIEKNP